MQSSAGSRVVCRIRARGAGRRWPQSTRACRLRSSARRYSSALRRAATPTMPTGCCPRCASSLAGMTRRKRNTEMGNTHNSRTTPADALVVFGVTGDLAHKMIFPALYAMAKRGVLNVPVVGVASSQWSQAQLRKRVKDSIKQAGKIDDRGALDHLLSLLRYVAGDYNDPGTFKALKQTLGEVRRPAHYLAIPPALFATVIEGLGAAGLADQARVIVEKPFGRDLASARELNRIALSVLSLI